VSRREAPQALRWTVYVAVAIVFAIACGFLSHWQFTRNEGREAQLALVEDNYDATPVPLGDVLPPGGVLDPVDEWTPVTLTGTYLADEQLLVRNRAHGGSAAYEVLVPFRQTDGRVLLIDRGWVPPGETQPEPDAVPAPPSGEVTVVARLRPAEPVPSSGRSAEPGQVPTINLGLVAEQTGPLEEGAYALLASESPAPATTPFALDPPSADPGPHLSYAIQWILFAVMGFGFIAYVIVTERRHRREDAEDAAAAAASGELPADLPTAVAAHRRRRRTRDRDAEDEDALLDSR
jgi:cytochrome oxidase assembly protein ShyY1